MLHHSPRTDGPVNDAGTARCQCLKHGDAKRTGGPSRGGVDVWNRHVPPGSAGVCGAAAPSTGLVAPVCDRSAARGSAGAELLRPAPVLCVAAGTAPPAT